MSSQQSLLFVCVLAVIAGVHVADAIRCNTYYGTDQDATLTTEDCPECNYCEYMLTPSAHTGKSRAARWAKPTVTLGALRPAVRDEVDEFAGLMSDSRQVLDTITFKVMSVCTYESMKSFDSYSGDPLEELFFRCVCNTDLCNAKGTFAHYLTNVADTSSSERR